MRSHMDVARLVGYESDAAFSKTFQRVVGANTGEYLKVAIKTEAMSEWRRYLKETYTAEH